MPTTEEDWRTKSPSVIAIFSSAKMEVGLSLQP